MDAVATFWGLLSLIVSLITNNSLPMSLSAPCLGLCLGDVAFAGIVQCSRF